MTNAQVATRRLRHQAWLAGLVGGLWLAMPAQAQLPAPPLASATAPLVFRGVTVIDVQTGRRVPNQAVVVVGHRIQRIEPATTARLPRGAQVIDARGKYLIPGLWDMHLHPQEYVDIAYPLLLAYGVTGMRDAGSSIPLATLGQWKREIAAGTRVGPRLIVSGPSITNANHDSLHVRRSPPGQFGHFIEVPLALANQVADSLKAAGADMLKLYGGGLPLRLAIIAAARRVGIPFGGHSEDMLGGVYSDSGAMILDHQAWDPVCGTGYDLRADTNSAACAALAQRLRRNHTWITVVGQFAIYAIENHGTPALRAWYATRLLDPAVRYLPHSLSESRTSRQANLDSIEKAVPAAARSFTTPTAVQAGAQGHPPIRFGHRAGLPMLLGSDASVRIVMGEMVGLATHNALVGFVLSGFSPLEALQTATLNPALALRATDSLGTVAAGKLADLVLLDADPLTEIMNTTKILAVVANGRYYDRRALDQLLTAAQQAAARS